MTLTEFADSRGLKVATVSNYIKRNHIKTERQGRNVIIPDESLPSLEKKYPKPGDEIVKLADAATKEILIKAQQEVIALQQRLLEVTKELGDAKGQLLLLEDKENQLAEANAEIERLKNRGLWDRLLNK